MKSALELTLENLRKSYDRALSGDVKAQETIATVATYRGDEQVSRLAGMLAEDLRSKGIVMVLAPCDVGDAP